MNQEQWIKKLKQEGFEDLNVCTNDPNTEFPEHTHNLTTTHVILEGELVLRPLQNPISAARSKFRLQNRISSSAYTPYKHRRFCDFSLSASVLLRLAGTPADPPERSVGGEI